MLYRIIYDAHSKTTYGLPKQPDTPTVNTLITRTTIPIILLLAMVDTTTLRRTVNTTTRTPTLRGTTTPITIRTTMLLWIVNTETHTTAILLTVPPVLLPMPTAMADTPTASPVMRGSVTTITITIQDTAAVATRKITTTIPLPAGLETLAPARVVDIPGTKAAN